MLYHWQRTSESVSILTIKYAFLVLQVHGATWKERGLLSSPNSPIKYGPEITDVLEAVHEPKEVAVVHLRRHQKDRSLESEGSNTADVQPGRLLKAC